MVMYGEIGNDRQWKGSVTPFSGGLDVHVYVRTSASVEPVCIIGSELLVVTSLHKVYPCRHLELARTL